jgi:hypothetical protein
VASFVGVDPLVGEHTFLYRIWPWFVLGRHFLRVKAPLLEATFN